MWEESIADVQSALWEEAIADVQSALWEESIAGGDVESHSPKVCVELLGSWEVCAQPPSGGGEEKYNML